MWLQAIVTVGLFSAGWGLTTEVVTDSGKIIGVVKNTRELPLPAETPTKFTAFLGVPYGKVFAHFEASVPVPNWSTPLIANKDGSKCIQPDGSGSEDCLFLNIYVPTSCPKLLNSFGKYAVDVFFHGGGYMRNSNSYDEFGPDFLIKKCVIIITVNTRLGPLGYLTTNDCNAPGNRGLEDAVLALKWIKKNIKYFEGDDTKITISGQSSGGSTVHLLTMSPLAKGLFRHAIVQSATAIAPWAAVPATYAGQAAFLLGSYFNISTTNSAELITRLQKISGADIAIMAYTNLVQFEFLSPFVPNWGPGSASCPSFIPKPPVQSLLAGEYNKDVSQTFGYNSKEGILFGLGFLEAPEDISPAIDFVSESYLPPLLGVAPSQVNSFAAELKLTYFGNQKASIATFSQVVKFISDVLFKCWITKTVDILRQNEKPRIYLYVFEYTGKYSIYSQYVNSLLESNNLPVIPGASHEDELDYILRRIGTLPGQTDYPITPVGSSERRTVDKMTTTWASIVEHVQLSLVDSISLGLLVTPWMPVSSQFNYLSINKTWSIKYGKDPACIHLDQLAAKYAT